MPLFCNCCGSLLGWPNAGCNVVVKLHPRMMKKIKRPRMVEVSLPNWQTTDITQKSYVIRKWKIWPLLAETVACPENPGSFITAVLAQPATGSDEVGLTKTLQKLEVLGLERPRELYADRAYISG